MRLRIAAIAIIALPWIALPAWPDERYFDFVAALEERGYYDLAVSYIEQLRDRPDVPAPIKALADLLIGKDLRVGAESLNDLSKRDEQLEQARDYFEKFIREQ